MRIRLRRLYIKNVIKRKMLNSLEKSVFELDRAIFKQYDRKIPYKAQVIHSNYFSGKTVYYQNNVKIEIRANEGKHNRPHFHVSVKQQNVSIALDNILETVEVLAGELDKKNMKKVVKWARENYTLLMGIWEQFHGSVVSVS